VRRSMAVIAVVVLLGACAVAIAQSQTTVVSYRAASGGTYTGLRPTALGLPQVGAQGTVGAGDYESSLRNYHDSGAYDRDVAAVVAAARRYLDERLAPAGAPSPQSKRVCTVRYVRAATSRKRRLYRRVRRCRRVTPGRVCTTRYRRVTYRGRRLYRRIRRCRQVGSAPAAPQGKPAIVLDIDETSLSNWSGIIATNFGSTATVGPAVAATGTAIQPTLDFYRYARGRGVAVFFVTGRPPEIQSQTEANLRSVGYDKGWNAINFKPGSTGTLPFKSGTRAQIERQGYDILLNLGDQESDLDGGHSDQDFKVPNPFYFISD
jgi:putative acid phosphatase of HAD superfamily subfamily IIIB